MTDVSDYANYHSQDLVASIGCDRLAERIFAGKSGSRHRFVDDYHWLARSMISFRKQSPRSQWNARCFEISLRDDTDVWLRMAVLLIGTSFHRD
jgi:hypothetical protein